MTASRGIGPALRDLVGARRATALAAALAGLVGVVALVGPIGPAGPGLRADAAAPRPAATAASRAPSVARELGLADDEVAAIVAHGPWPPPFEPDPTNRASGHPAAIELGRRLFVDPRASADGARRCSDCHVPALGFSDGRRTSIGADGRPLDRNAPGLLDVRTRPWLGWDGGADSLWAFVLRPLAAPNEIGTDDRRLAALFDADPALACLRRAAFGEPRPAGDGLRVQVAKAIAAWLETLESPRTRFDALRDALAGSTDPATLRAARDYPPQALRGLRRFVGDARCALCHVGPTFSSGEFHDAGRPHLAAPGRPDPGRHGGVRTVLADPFNRLGRWSDAPPAAGGAADPAVRTRHLAPAHRNFGEFRVPGLRDLDRTAPYGHDGSMRDLGAVVAHYSDLDIERLHADGEALLRPLRLDPAGRAELLAFLVTLSEPLAEAPPAPSAARPAPARAAAADTCTGRPAP